MLRDLPRRAVLKRAAVCGRAPDRASGAISSRTEIAHGAELRGDRAAGTAREVNVAVHNSRACRTPPLPVHPSSAEVSR